MMESEYAFLEARILFIEGEIGTLGDRVEITRRAYGKIYDLMDYVPSRVRDFVEWWCASLDAEAIKSFIAAAMAGKGIGSQVALLRMRRKQPQPLTGSDSGSLSTILRAYPDLAPQPEGLSSLTYSQAAHFVDSRYFRAFEEKYPQGYEGGLAKRLVSLKVDFLNSRLAGRVLNLERHLLPGGLLDQESLKDEAILAKGLSEHYGIDSLQMIPRFASRACGEEGTGFARIMGLLVKWDPVWGYLAS